MPGKGGAALARALPQGDGIRFRIGPQGCLQNAAELMGPTFQNCDNPVKYIGPVEDNPLFLAFNAAENHRLVKSMGCLLANLQKWGLPLKRHENCFLDWQAP